MADAVLTSRARAHAEHLLDVLRLWQPESLRGKHAPGMPYYGALGVNFADFVMHLATSGRPLGD
eukprot:11349738-Alexandrium_andersonii.AAC.1